MKGPPPPSPIGAVLEQAGNVEAELRAAVDIPPDALLVLVPRYYGMSRADAIRFRFGSEEVPAGLTAVLMTNALPPGGVSVDWWTLPRDSDAFRAAADACTRLAVGLSSAGL